MLDAPAAIIFAFVCDWALCANKLTPVFDRSARAHGYLVSVWLVFALSARLEMQRSQSKRVTQS